MSNLPEAEKVSSWSRDEQISWAESYGANLFEENKNMINEEETVSDAWIKVYDENENQISQDVGTVSTVSFEQDSLVHAMRSGFIEAFNNSNH